ncbi:uncharacterized protein ppp1r3aa isoform X1 [Cyprinodon tularosa]|uniref:uncharacterized protein ppp1r3aa isoform X1 n=2 Tax=Cyprinodon tularosa TaxID=77115 RepID=UPI0018E24D76|nr:uncharacterized protein ppp1r3aa isoform X1 [Cyprinodon tularosa]XP_038159823.1 uncharacterized protein ppp1r3aa isoform X1 [Cyprinodon tularosa]
MEALIVQPHEGERGMHEEEEYEKNGELDEGEIEPSSPVASRSEDDTDEDSEPEPPPVIRRKVSFADAFGLDLVSVKEFDNAEVTESEASWSDGRKVVQSPEEIYLSCLFTVPSSTEELDQKLCEQMVELESIELLPGTTTLRGIIRVVNLCYNKSVYARVTLDHWSSYFDLLAEYIPGSSDRRTDRFTFRYTVVPPFEKEGTRVEFCLRYETPVGTFWANNKGMNYVMFCHQKTPIKDHVTPTEEESSSYKSKRSCLKANSRNEEIEEKNRESAHTSMAAADMELINKVQKTCGERTSLSHKDQKPWVESVKSRRRAIRLARVQDYLCQKEQQQSKAFPHDSACGQKVSQHVSAVLGDSPSYVYKSQKVQSSESPRVLTYHQIPLLSLDWNSHTPEQPGTADVDHILAARAKITLSKESVENTPTVNDMWESFSKTIHDSKTKETSVSDVWQVFLNRSSCKHYSDVPESEWLQTTAPVLPSNSSKSLIQDSEESQEFLEVRGTPKTLHSLASCQLLSDSCETLLDANDLKAKDNKAEQACVSRPEDDNQATQDASQRSETNSVTDTPKEFNLKRATALSMDKADNPTECHKRKDWEQEGKAIIETVGRGEAEPFALHTPDSVTSSGESETTDMTVMPENPNASHVDTISPDAKQDGGVSSSREREVTGTAHNEIDDIVAFRETISKETRDKDSYVFAASRKGKEEEEIMMNYTAKEVQTEKEIFRPGECKEFNNPLRNADKIQHEEFRQSPNGKINENETETTKRHADGFGLQQMDEENTEKEINILVDKNKDGSSSNFSIGVIKTEVGATMTESKEIEDVTNEGSKLTNILDEVQCKHDDRSASLLMKEHNIQSVSVKVNEELLVKNREDFPLIQIKQSDDQEFNMQQQEIRYDGKEIDQKETGPFAELSPIVDSLEVIFCQNKDNTQIPCHPDQYDPLEMVKPRLTDPQKHLQSQKPNSSRDLNPEELMAKRNYSKKDTSAEHGSEASRGAKQDHSKEDEKLCGERLKIEAMRELMGNPESPWGENKIVRKGQESSAEVTSPPHVEHNKLREGTKDPITVENSPALEVTQSELEPLSIERFGENLICSILEEVFAQKLKPTTWHPSTVGDTKGRLTETTQDHCPVDEKNLSDPLDSSTFLLTEFSVDSSANLYPGLEPILFTEDNENSSIDMTKPLSMTEDINRPSELQSDWDSTVYRTPIAHSEEPTYERTQSLSYSKDQESRSTIKARSVPHPEKDFEIEDCIFVTTERFDQSSNLSKKYQSSSEKLKESNALLWWTVLYTISHITKLLICALLIGGFFVAVFLYDFPSFFALYTFSMSCWIFKWKRQQVRTGDKTTE